MDLGEGPRLEVRRQLRGDPLGRLDLPGGEGGESHGFEHAEDLGGEPVGVRPGDSRDVEDLLEHVRGGTMSPCS